MKAALFIEPGRIVLDEKPIPEVGSNNALIRITTTTICGADTHILKGEFLSCLSFFPKFTHRPES